jgi:hypothetical protein
MVRILNVEDLAPAPGRSGRFEGHEHGASVHGSPRMIQEDLPDASG